MALLRSTVNRPSRNGGWPLSGAVSLSSGRGQPHSRLNVCARRNYCARGGMARRRSAVRASQPSARGSRVRTVPWVVSCGGAPRTRTTHHTSLCVPPCSTAHSPCVSVALWRVMLSLPSPRVRNRLLCAPTPQNKGTLHADVLHVALRRATCSPSYCDSFFPRPVCVTALCAFPLAHIRNTALLIHSRVALSRYDCAVAPWRMTRPPSPY